MPGFSERLGRAVRDHRADTGLTQRQLADLVGISVRTLRSIEQSRVRHPNQGTLRRLAKVVDVDDLRDANDPAGSADSITVGVLGTPTVWRAGRPKTLRSTRQRDLLGLLGLCADQVVTHDEIVDVLWGASPPPSAIAVVHTSVAQLRAVLEPRRRIHDPGRLIVAVRGGYLLAVPAQRIDATRFTSLVDRATDHEAGGDPRSAVGLYTQALDCWRGPVAPGLRAHPAGAAMSMRRVDAGLRFAELATGQGLAVEAVRQLRVLILDEPFHEDLRAELMLALAGSGQQAAALEVFHELRTRLNDELGIEPGPHVQDAYLRVLHGTAVPADAPARIVPIRHDVLPPAQLPPDIAGFAGREPHLARLDSLMADGEQEKPAHAVIAAIVGTAGVGKTTLAVHWAHRVKDRFDDGQLFLDLRGYSGEPPTRPIEALTRFLRALGMPPERIPINLDEAVGLYRTLLANRRVLIVLDNAAGPAQVRPLLTGGADCRVVVTSRNRLTDLVAREGAGRITLDVLEPESARELLAQQLGAPRVDREPEATARLAELCAYLPLALRLAGANVVDAPHRMVAHFVDALARGDRLVELDSDGDEPTVLRNAFDLSVLALTEDMRQVFLLLGLIPGPDVTAPAAAALTGLDVEAAGRILARLRSVHLLDEHVSGRYSFHDLLRLYAAERVQSDVPAARRHAAIGRLYDWHLFCIDHAATLVYPDVLRLPATVRRDDTWPLPFDDPDRAQRWLDAERANLLAAIYSAGDHGLHRAAYLLADGLRCYLWLRSHFVDWEAAANAAVLAANADGDLRGQAAAQLSLADLKISQNLYQQAERHHARGLLLARRADWREGQAGALLIRARILLRFGRLIDATAAATGALELSREVGRSVGEAHSLCLLAALGRALGGLHEAAEHCTRAVAIYSSVGSLHRQAFALRKLGEIRHDLRESDIAEEHLHRALALSRSIGNPRDEILSLRGLALIQCDRGSPGPAATLAGTALEAARQLAERSIEAEVLNTCASIQYRMGRVQEAIGLHQEALEIARLSDDRYPEVEALIGLASGYRNAAFARRAFDISRQIGFRVLATRALAVLNELDEPDEPDESDQPHRPNRH